MVLCRGGLTAGNTGQKHQAVTMLKGDFKVTGDHFFVEQDADEVFLVKMLVDQVTVGWRINLHQPEQRCLQGCIRWQRQSS